MRRSLAVTLPLLAIMAAGFAGAWFFSQRGPVAGRASNADQPKSDEPIQPHATNEPLLARQAPPSGPLPEPPADPRANMVLVAAGKFLFGKDKREVELPDYYIDRYEVSQQEYGRFLEYIRRTDDHSHCDPKEPKGKDHTPLNWGRPNLTDPRWPVVGIDYWDCWAYAGWVGKRLPSEEEWEKAARGADGRLYPWGDAWDPAKANWGPSPGDAHTLMAVDALPEGRSPYGCHHMLGNAAEWTASFIDEARGVHCGRGYCWRLGHMLPFVVTYRMPGGTNLRDEGSGVRCALDAK
ncbi:MAG TPA: SUMF1/EgtB/PvdO family nonheme iron enzyme [Pirellulales bacterium]|nr:SUMF1/EgtB/PvdO family nonheme iron enzyme [Pirellulales bacterium]